MNKNFARIAALSLVIVMLAVTFVSCGGLSGTYTAGLLGQSVSYKFSGGKVTLKFTILGNVKSVEGTYKINGDEITFMFGDKDAEKHAGTKTFKKGDGYIEIGGIQYTKEK